MDEQVVVMFSTTKVITRNHLKVHLSKAYNRKCLPGDYEQSIEDVWMTRLSKNPTLWNGTKFRLECVSSDSNTVVFSLGMTSYKDFIGTNWSPDARLYAKLGLDDHGNAQAYMSDALGVGAFVETADQRVVFLKRSEKCAEAPGLWDIPGGHPEPCMLIGKQSADEVNLARLSQSEVVNEIFHSMLREIHDEVNVPIDSLTDPLLIGVARNTTSAGRPSSEYYVRCSLTSSEIETLYNQGTHEEADESTKIMFLPVSLVATLQTDDTTLWNQLAPSAKGCLILYTLSQNA